MGPPTHCPALRGICRASIALVLFVVAGTADARQETLRWLDPSAKPSPVAGFRIRFGLSPGVHPAMNDVGLPTPDGDGIYSATISVPDGAVAYLVVSAYDQTGTETAPSNEIQRVPIGAGLPPSASPDAYVLVQDTVLEVAPGSGVLANDADPESDPMTAQLITDVAAGTLDLNVYGGISYAPPPGFIGATAFTYAASDGNLTSNATTTTLIVISDEPSASGDYYNVEPEITLVVDVLHGVLSNDVDPSGGPLTAVLEKDVASGALALAPDGSFSYTPAPGFSGTDAFTYRANALGRLSEPATVMITSSYMAANLRGHWRLDEGVGTTAGDSGPGGHDGTVAGASWTADTPLGNGFALRFDGVDDRVDLGAVDVPGQVLTISLWFAAESFPADAALVSKATGAGAAATDWRFGTTNTGVPRLTLSLRAGGETSTLVAQGGDLEVGVFTHVAAVYDGVALHLYKDGVEVGSAFQSGMLAPSPARPAAIGNLPQGAGNLPFHGTIDDVRIYDRALTLPQLIDLSTGNASFPPATASLEVAEVATGFETPVYVTAPQNDTRLFVLEAGGKVWIVEGGTVLPTPFLDLSADVSASPGGGLLSLAFAPDFWQTGFFYVHRTAANGDAVLSRFAVGADPDVADPASEQVLLQLEQPFVGQNGGAIAFGPDDGFLYVGQGDGGSNGDPGNRAQDGDSLLGKVLRLDVGLPPRADSIPSGPYAVPATNPFVGDPEFRDEIWAFGLRHPYRFAFDPELGDLWLADEGQGAREEINFEPAGAAGGSNYGWDVMEGSVCNADDPAPAPPCGDLTLVPPLHDYPHVNGNCAITGGLVARGPAEELAGEYFFGDFCSGAVYSLDGETGGGTDWTQAFGSAAGIASQLVSFGEDGYGNLYVVHSAGNVFGIDAGGPPCDVAVDSDCDGVSDAGDNCPYAHNPAQLDTAGIGVGSAPDGIGDVCQCGDVNGDGAVTSADSTIILRSLLVPPTAEMDEPQLCDVGGDVGCSSGDSAIVLRAQQTPPTATIEQVCAPAVP